MPRNCIVPACQSSPKFVRLFSVPYTNKPRWEAWCNVCPFLLKLSPMQLANARFCPLHFKPEHINEQNRLTGDAIPTLLLDAPSLRGVMFYNAPLFNRRHLKDNSITSTVNVKITVPQTSQICSPLSNSVLPTTPVRSTVSRRIHSRIFSWPVQYIICECGDNFQSQNALREHQAKDCLRKSRSEQILTEYECGDCGKIYQTVEACVAHQEKDHTVAEPPDDLTYIKDVQFFIKDNKLFYRKTPKVEKNIKIEVKEEPDKTVEDDMPKEEQESIINKQVVCTEEDDVEQTAYANEPACANRDNVYLVPHTLIKSEPSEEKKPLMSYVKSEPPEVKKVVANAVMHKKVYARGKQKLKKVPMPHGSQEKVQVTDGEKEKKKVYAKENAVCEVCGKKYASMATLRCHRRVHTGERPFQCAYCPKSYTMRFFLQMHIRRHTGERPFQCPHCPKAFSERAALVRHDRVHSGVKPYKCPRCGRAFTQSNSMKLHVRTVHLKLPAPYKRRAGSRARARRAPPANTPEEEVSTEQVEAFPSDGEVFYCEVPAAR